MKNKQKEWHNVTKPLNCFCIRTLYTQYGTRDCFPALAALVCPVFYFLTETDPLSSP